MTKRAAYLALACARTGQRVILVDADLRRPMVTEYLGVDAETGLTNILAGDADLDTTLRRFDEGAKVRDLPTPPVAHFMAYLQACLRA